MEPISAILGIGNALIERFFPEPSKAAEAKLKLLELQQSGELAQMAAQTEINKLEAQNASIFVSGWRPAIGWVCVAALAYQYLVRPLAIGLAASQGVTMPLVGLDDNLWQLLMGMLGLGGLRTYEKISGVASK